MMDRVRLFVRRRRRAVVAALGVVLFALVPAQAGMVVARRSSPSAEPSPSPSSVPSPSATPVATETPATPSPSPVPLPVQARVFAGLGTWVDHYDYPLLEPLRAVAEMKAHGVRTLFVETGRFKDTFSVEPGLGPWIVAAHQSGLRIVGWYLPSYRDVARDVARTRAAARFRYRNQRLDGIAIDVEFKEEVPDSATWNARAVKHLRAVRASLGTAYPIAVISPPPLGMATAPEHWAGFPWRALAASSDAWVLMDYWSYRADRATNPAHQPFTYTTGNVSSTRTLTGRADLPIHVVGGVAHKVTAGDVDEFLRASKESNVIGTSLYDFRTTGDELWTKMATIT